MDRPRAATGLWERARRDPQRRRARAGVGRRDGRGDQHQGDEDDDTRQQAGGAALPAARAPQHRVGEPDRRRELGRHRRVAQLRTQFVFEGHRPALT